MFIDNLNLKDLDLNALSDEQAKALRDGMLTTVITKSRDDFYTFVKVMASTMIPEGFQDGRHIHKICYELQLIEESVARGDGEKLQIFLPPGFMKSLLASRLFVAWCFGRHPAWNILAIGNNTRFAEDNFGRPIKELMNSEEYKAIFPGTTLKKDVRSAGRWETEQGGKYFCAGVGTAIAGRRAHISVCGLDTNKVKEKTLGWISLKELKKGMSVLGRKGYEKVSKVLACHHKEVYTINNSIDVSPEHPLFVKSEGWVEVRDLRINDKILTGETLWKKIKNYMKFGEE